MRKLLVLVFLLSGCSSLEPKAPIINIEKPERIPGEPQTCDQYNVNVTSKFCFFGG